MKRKLSVIERAPLETRIVTVRGEKVILDLDLADLYGVTTKRLNEQVKRNTNRLPTDFAFVLAANEKAEVVANCDHLTRLKFSPVLPRAFTEHGALMAANVLNSPRAVTMSLYIVRAFVKMREQQAANAAILKRLPLNSVGGPCEASNGIALSKTAHWLFDRGFWSINDDYTVVVKNGASEEAGDAGQLLEPHAGHQILLPNSRGAWPDPSFLAWHRANHGFRAGH